MTLYHYTCRHRARAITRYGTLRPFPQPLFAHIPLIWLTDMDVPDAEALGLTKQNLPCDRTECRYVVETTEAIPWLQAETHAALARLLVKIIGPIPLIAFEDGRRPDRWWVATRALPARQDRWPAAR